MAACSVKTANTKCSAPPIQTKSRKKFDNNEENTYNKCVVKKLSHFFGKPLTFLLTISLLSIIWFGIATQLPYQCPPPHFDLPQFTGTPLAPTPTPPWYDNLTTLPGSELLSSAISILYTVSFVVSLFYFALGISRYLLTVLTRKKEKKETPAKVLVLRGIIGMFLSFLCYFGTTIILGLFLICL